MMCTKKREKMSTKSHESHKTHAMPLMLTKIFAIINAETNVKTAIFVYLY